MSKLTVIARRDGFSATGSVHGLLVETANDGTVRFTVTGHDGKKRHAAVTLPIAEVLTLMQSVDDYATEYSGS